MTSETTSERLRIAVTAARRDTVEARAAVTALVLGVSKFPNDADAALSHARALTVGRRDSVAERIDEIEHVARTYTEGQLAARIGSARATSRV